MTGLVKMALVKTGLVKIFQGAEAYRDYVAALPHEPARVEAAVAEILRRVREEGDRAVLEYTERFDGVRPRALRVPSTELDQAVAYLDPAVPESEAAIHAAGVDYVFVPQVIGRPDSFAEMQRWRPPFIEPLKSPFADAPYLELVQDFDGAQIWKVNSAASSH